MWVFSSVWFGSVRVCSYVNAVCVCVCVQLRLSSKMAKRFLTFLRYDACNVPRVPRIHGFYFSIVILLLVLLLRYFSSLFFFFLFAIALFSLSFDLFLYLSHSHRFFFPSVGFRQSRFHLVQRVSSYFSIFCLHFYYILLAYCVRQTFRSNDEISSRKYKQMWLTRTRKQQQIMKPSKKREREREIQRNEEQTQ